MAASIDTSYVRRELRAIASASHRVKHLLQNALEKIETSPSQFDELNYVSPKIKAAYSGVVMRKVRIQCGQHNYRLILAHWTFADGREHVDILYAFPRQDGYPIDWDEVGEMLGE